MLIEKVCVRTARTTIFGKQKLFSNEKSLINFTVSNPVRKRKAEKVCECYLTLITWGPFWQSLIADWKCAALKMLMTQASEKTVWLFQMLTALIGSLLVYSCILGSAYIR